MSTEAQTCAIGILTILVALHLSRVLYEFTPFMQNKPNLLNAQMNASSFVTKDYENDNTFRLPENKPNTKPIKPNTKPIQTQFPRGQK
jgi:hypothetical protein